METNTIIKEQEFTIAPQSEKQIVPFLNGGNFEQAWRMAKCLSFSTLVPEQYRGEKNTSNCMIALELASRHGMSPFMVMQNLYVIQGRPSWSSQFLIAMINVSGRFSPLRWRVENNGRKKFGAFELDDISVRCYATELSSGEVLEGPAVTAEMVVSEGWYGKNGSKWKTMPEVMYRYRSASFFSRMYCPDIAMGIYTKEETDDEPRQVKKIPQAGHHDLEAAVEELRENGVLEPEPKASKKSVFEGVTPNDAKPAPSEDESKEEQPEQSEQKAEQKEPAPEQKKPDARIKRREELMNILTDFGLGFSQEEAAEWIGRTFKGRHLDDLTEAELNGAINGVRKEIDRRENEAAGK